MNKDNVRAILSEPVLSDAAHKKRISAKLFEQSRELSIDDLEHVIGGLAVDRSFFENWQDFPKDMGR